MNTPRNERSPQRTPGGAQGPTSDGAAEGPEAPEPPRPSRSARKREALALQELGVRLTLLKPAQLQRLSLPEQLLAAVLEAQRLTSRAALARQRQYIGKLIGANALSKDARISHCILARNGVWQIAAGVHSIS